ncbi:hypothetical protein BJY01DRAFT_226800 [Aspergillus pseudoustus]|uniref:F-box domain-containing protein n=1 Tax=Aspergillus pseudoustus TaxID=1810923 RepID=A0ABR4ITC8_9EURO
MGIHLPPEILNQVLRDLLDDLLSADSAERNCRQKAFELRLVSRLVQNMVDPVLYRTIIVPPDSEANSLAKTMVARRHLAAKVEEIELEEDEECRCDEEDEEEEGEESDSDSEPDLTAESQPPPERTKPLAAAADALKHKFTADPTSYARALEKNNLDWLTISNQKTRKWILLLQLSNLTSLTLKTHTDTFTNMALFIRLPRLEHLEFAVLAPGPDGYTNMDNYAPPEQILESIIGSSKSGLRSLTFEDMSGSACSPVRHDARKLKRVLDQHTAQTLTYLSVCFSNNDERDWRLPQEWSDIVGAFGSMKHFTKLEGLVMQLEALLGRPGNAGILSLRDVLPVQLQYFTGINIPDYHGPTEDASVWEEDYYLAQFRDLAAAAVAPTGDCQGFPALESVKMYLHRKDWFNHYDYHVKKEGRYEDGILGDSRIYFGWVRGPRANDGPGPD